MSRQLILRVRDPSNPSNPFKIANFGSGGWKVRNATNTGWVAMTPNNTQIRNPDFDESIAEDDSNPKYLQVYEGE